MKTALVIGGTGMLKTATETLATKYDVVGVVGRSSSRLSVIATDTVIPLQVDYSNSKAPQTCLNKHTDKYGRADLIVSWIHATSPDATLVVADYGKGDFYEVTGSPDSVNHSLSFTHEPEITAKGLTYHRVTLGSINGRWLTNQEISQGVLEAVEERNPEFVVGSL